MQSSYVKQGNVGQAIIDFTQAVEIDSNHASAYYDRGLAYAKKRNWDQSISDCSKTLEIDPNRADAYNNRGIGYFYKTRYDEGWSDIHKAEALGIKAEPAILENFKKASGREK